MDKYYLPPLEKLTEYFEGLPSIGRKTAARLAYSVLKMPQEKAQAFAEAILDAKKSICYCKKCCNFTDKEVCDICTDNSRDKSIVCVVEESKDVCAIERTQEFHALYHVLHGAISPLNGVGPDEISIKELLQRVKKETVKEIIMATNPTVEGEATAMYVSRLLRPLGIKVTRLAYGVPVGASLEYADEVTLSRAISGRSEII
jgi:recombination protein RecR